MDEKHALQIYQNECGPGVFLYSEFNPVSGKHGESRFIGRWNQLFRIKLKWVFKHQDLQIYKNYERFSFKLWVAITWLDQATHIAFPGYIAHS